MELLAKMKDNLQSQKETNKPSTDEVVKQFVNWQVKIDFLKDQILKLEKLTNFPIFAIAAFLLKCQIIEFELKQAIFSIDSHLYFQSKSQKFKRRVRTPKDLDNLTLGLLVGEVDKFIGPTDPAISINIKDEKNNSSTNTLGRLKGVLHQVVGKRNEFTHRLFSSGKDIKTLIKQAEDGISDVNKALELLKNIEQELKNDEV